MLHLLGLTFIYFTNLYDSLSYKRKVTFIQYIHRPTEVQQHEGSAHRLPGHGKSQLLHLQYHESPAPVKSPWEPCRYCNITYVTINSVTPPLILKKNQTVSKEWAQYGKTMVKAMKIQGHHT